MVLRIVAEAKQRSMGMEPDEKVLEYLQQSTAQKLDGQSTALYGTARLWDDGLVDPRDTRKILALVLDICREAEQRKLMPNTFGVARF
jgi:geranyl-CoA carboxylase beta subunit